MNKHFAFVFLLIFAQAAIGKAQIFGLNEQLNGNYSYTMFGNTLLPTSNQISGACSLLESSTETFTYDSNLKIAKAYLYYASNGLAVEDVYLNDQKAKFLRSNHYTSKGDPNYLYFFAKADVTDIVKSTGAGDYTFKGLETAAYLLNPYCYDSKTSGGLCAPNGDLFGGWAVLVIFESSRLPYTSLSIFDGYRFASDFTLTDMDIQTSDTSEASFSFLAWEGDYSGANEYVTLNGIPLENDLNAYPNLLFNQSNSFTNKQPLWGMDLDYFDISNYLDSSSTNAKIDFFDNGFCADLAIIQVCVLNIENRLPNPSIEFVDAIPSVCGTNEIDLNLTIKNENTSDVLPAGVPIYIYKKTTDRPLLSTVFTQEQVAANSSYELKTTILLDSITLDFTELEVVINTDRNGNRAIAELNPEDNVDDIRVENLGKVILFFPTAISPNYDGNNDFFQLLNSGDCAKNIEDYHLTIYQRYGQKVFNTNDINEVWNATINSSPVASDLYLWYASYYSKANRKSYSVNGSFVVLY